MSEKGWKGDVEYTIAHYRPRLASNLAAVLAISDQFNDPPGRGFDHLLAVTPHIQRRWRSFIQSAYRCYHYDEGRLVFDWLPIRDSRGAQIMRNCPPALVKATLSGGRRLNFCKVDPCPFCKARRVSQVYQGCVEALEARNLLHSANHKMVVFQSKFLMDNPSTTELQSSIKWIYGWRAARFRKWGMLGALYYTTVVPLDAEAWWITTRYLCFVEKDWVRPNNRGSVVSPINRKSLAYAIGRTMRYPVELLNSNVELVVPILNAIRDKRLRLTERMGVLRCPRVR